jgi:sialate O-acetylesterase
MISRFTLRIAIVLAASLLGFNARADVKLPNLFSDHMVLQQGAKVPVWGWAEDGEKITVEFKGQKVSTVAKGGRWMVKLSRLKADATPATLKVTGSNTIEIRNVLVGEVWIASGQSNMQWAMNQAHEPQADIANSTHPHLRLLYVPRTRRDAPTNNIDATWTLCEPKTVEGFSAVAYYFGRDLQRALGVPVGIIHTSWGGSPAEVWMREEALSKNPDYKRDILDPYPKAEASYKAALAKWQKDSAEAKKAKKPLTTQPPRAPWKPTELYNGMIAPLIPVAIKGAIWYQGESNAGRAHQYRSLFADMIKNWRQDWDNDFTFLLVQLAPFKKIETQPGDSDWAELREAQLLATQKLPKVGMAVITDVGEENDIHPKKKAPVGARLALAARGIAYGEKIEYSGPVFRSLKIKGHEAVVSFSHVGRGLEARGGELRGFAICGDDRKWVWGKAEIRGSTVVVTSPEVAKPVAVRYGWANYPVVNLWNKDGLPATPFRTDNFPMITAPRPVAKK